MLAIPTTARRIAIMVVALLLLSACSSADETEATPDAPEVTEPETAATAEADGDTEAATEADVGTADGALAGETIEFVVPYDPGGGYDLYARAIAPYLEEATGATVVVRNEPGAGGLAATAQTFAADPDGQRIQIVNGLGTLAAQLGGSEGALFEANDFSWLGRVSGEPDVVVASPESGFDSLDDLAAADEVRMVALGPGSNTYIDALVLQEVLDLQGDIIVGFQGAPEALTSLLRGEADVFSSSLSSLSSAIESGDVVPLGVFAQDRADALPDVPTVSELESLDEQDRALLEAHSNLIASGRSIVAPPGMSEELLGELRSAFDEVLTDPELAEEASSQDRPIDFVPGSELADMVEQVMSNAPEAYQELIEQSFTES